MVALEVGPEVVEELEEAPVVVQEEDLVVVGVLEVALVVVEESEEAPVEALAVGFS